MPDIDKPLPDRLPRIAFRRVLAGFSGGADSTALLRLLALARARDGFELKAVHVHHGLRGAEADGDAAFCEALCRELEVPLTVVRLSLPPDCGEGEARDARYRAFREVCRAEGCDALALAHHADDQAETLLLRLLRGSGLDGLAGMRPARPMGGITVLRPLLGFTRRELTGYLEALGQPWREDSSNQTDRYLRNRVRRELLPLMEELAPGAAVRLARTAASLAEDGDALNRLADGLRAEGGPLWLRLAPLERAPAAVRRRALRAWWAAVSGQTLKEHALSYEDTLALETLALGAPDRWLNLPGGVRVYRGANYLHLVPDDWRPPEPAVFDGDTALGGCRLTARPSAGEPGDGRRAQEVPAGWAQGLTLRTARPGDWIRPFGSGHSRPLHDYFQSRRTELPFRRAVPLLCRGDEVLLAAGLGAGDLPPWRAGEAHERLVWTGPMPWAEDKTDP